MYYKLKKTILESGLKQKFIAEQLHMHPLSFSKKLNGGSSWKFPEKYMISEILGVPIEDLFVKGDKT